jgi:diguanylate cyclase (GGDEF)-like protein
MGDIDHFKAINDHFGHQIGDVVLKHLAEFLRHGLRRRDYVARWGGEEFTLLFPETRLGHAEEVLNRLRARIARHTIPEIAQHVTLSFGLTEYAKSDTPDDVLKRIDQAIYLSKESGRNTVTTVQPGPAG